MGRGGGDSLPFSLSPSPLPLPFLRLPRRVGEGVVFGKPGGPHSDFVFIFHFSIFDFHSAI